MGINKLLNERTTDKQGETLLVLVPCGRTCFSQKKASGDYKRLEFHRLAENTNVRSGLLKESPKQKINGLTPYVAPLRNFSDPSLRPKGTKRRRSRGVTCRIMRVLPIFPLQKVHKLGRILLPPGIYRYRYRCISIGTNSVKKDHTKQIFK